MKKRILALLMSVILVIGLSACGSSGSNAEDPVHINSSVDPAPPETPKSAPLETSSDAEVPLESSGTLGDYDVQINGFEIAKDYSGEPSILVDFTFENNSKENAIAIVALNFDAYQNGIELDSAIISDSGLYNPDDLMKGIQPGASIDVKAAYLLTSETAPVEFEIAETFALSDDKLGKTFEIAEGGITELSVAPNGDPSGNIGDYTISIVSRKIVDDYQSAKAILFELGFTNNSNDVTSYITQIDFTAFQNGVELETAIISDPMIQVGSSQMRNVKPGAGTTVYAAYLLSSDTSPVDIEIEEYFGFSGDKLEAEVSISQ